MPCLICREWEYGEICSDVECAKLQDDVNIIPVVNGSSGGRRGMMMSLDVSIKLCAQVTFISKMCLNASSV